MDNLYQELFTEHQLNFINAVIFNYEKFEDLSTNEQKHFTNILKTLDNKSLYSVLLQNNFCQDFESSSEHWLKFFLDYVPKEFFKIKTSNKYVPLENKEENFIYTQIHNNINMGEGLWKAIKIALPYYNHKSKGFFQVVTPAILSNLHELGVNSHSRVSNEELINIQKNIFKELEKYDIFSSIHPTDFLKFVLHSQDQPDFFIAHFDMIDKYLDWNSNETRTWLEENIVYSYQYSNIEDRNKFFTAMDLIYPKLNKKLTFHLEEHSNIINILKKELDTEEFKDFSKLYKYVNIDLTNIEPALLHVIEKATVYKDILEIGTHIKKKEKHKI